MDDISQRTKTGLKIRFLTDDKEGEVEERGRDRFGQRFVTERAQVLETFCPPRRDQEVGARVSIFSPGTEQRFSQFKQDVWCRPLFDLETDDQSWKRFVSISWSRSVSVSIIRGREIVGKRCIRGRRGWEKTPWLIARFGGRDQRSRFVASSSRFLAIYFCDFGIWESMDCQVERRSNTRVRKEISFLRNFYYECKKSRLIWKIFRVLQNLELYD